MSVSGGQSYKEIVQLTLRAEKLTSERMFQKKFQKRKGFGFVSGQSSKKSCSFESFGNLSRFGTNSVSSPQTFKSPQPSRLDTSPSSSTFRGRMMSEMCLCCKQIHLGVCNMPQRVCFRCGQTRHVKKYYPLLNNIGSVGQSPV